LGTLIGVVISFSVTDLAVTIPPLFKLPFPAGKFDAGVYLEKAA
jgi:hypothetical protein